MKNKNNLNSMKEQLEKWGLNPDTFCFAPYITTDLDQIGHIRSCYRGKNDLGNWKEEKFTDVFNNEHYKELRKSLYSGTKHKNCMSCWNAEEKNAQSPRADIFDDALEYIQNIEKFVANIKKDVESGNISDLCRIEIRPSLLCNLRCMHCGPDSSTKWIQKLTEKENFNVYKEIVGFDAQQEDNIDFTNINEYYKKGLNSESEYKEDIKELLASTKQIQFAGGEPLLTPEHEEWLDYLVNISKTSNKQDLDYNSNFNLKNIEKYFDYWNKFKSVRIRASIDTSFDTYEYFRAEGDVELLKSNINKFNNYFSNNENITLSGTVTFNMFSALSWKRILKDWVDYNLEFHASLVLNNPVSSIQLPNSLKDRVVDDITETIETVHLYTNNKKFIKDFKKHSLNCLEYVKNSKREFEKMPVASCRYIEMCDRINKKNIFDYFPELKGFWNGMA